jgi:hypothetical protein
MPDPFRPGATVTDAWSYRGFQAIVLENEDLRCVVLPGHGARITELVHKRAGRDLLYHHPRFDVRPPVFGVNVDDWWTGGIDEVAPTAHPCVVDGEQLPFLGEFWSQAWEHRIEDEGGERAIVHLWASGIITPLRIDRWLEVCPGEPMVRARHRLTNLADRPLALMWESTLGSGSVLGAGSPSRPARVSFGTATRSSGSTPETPFTGPICPPPPVAWWTCPRLERLIPHRGSCASRPV